MKIERKELATIMTCDDCRMDQATFVVSMAESDPWHHSTFTLCEGCLAEMQALKVPEKPKPRYSVVPAPGDWSVVCHPTGPFWSAPGYLVLDDKQRTTTQTGGPYCQACATEIAEVLNKERR